VSWAESYTKWGEHKGASAFVLVGNVDRQRTVAEGTVFPHQNSRTSFIPWTITTFVVERLLLDGLGTNPGKLEALQEGPIPPNMWSSTVFPLPEIGERYLVFFTPSLTPNLFYSVGAFQGTFHIDQRDHVGALKPEWMQGELCIRDAPLVKVLEALVTAPILDGVS